MMKKALCALLIAGMLMPALAACAAPEKAAPLNIGALKGPTGMGITGLMGTEYGAQYAITLSGAPDEIAARFISGEIDVAAAPVNLAAMLYSKLEGDVVMLAVNTLGVLYVLENGESVQSVADLAGKTLYATGQGATPEYILNCLLEKNGVAGDVKVEYLSEHSELATRLAAGDVTLGMLPEPNVTATLAQNNELRVALDLTAEWDKVCDATLVMGCLIARKSFAEANRAAIDAFLTDYEASVRFVNDHHEKAALLIEQYGVMAKAALAKQAIGRCNIVCMRGAQMQEAAEGMLGVLFAADPRSVGGKLPGADFYYGA